MGTKVLRHGLAVMVGAVLLAGSGASVAHAFEPVGACCLTNGECLSVVEVACDTQGGEFIGPDTSCLMIECNASVQVPLLSLFGVVAAVGALGGLGVYRLVVRRPAV